MFMFLVSTYLFKVLNLHLEALFVTDYEFRFLTSFLSIHYVIVHFQIVQI
jgi:hypothetical protein